MRLRRRPPGRESGEAASHVIAASSPRATPSSPSGWPAPRRPPERARGAASVGYIRQSHGPGWALVGDAGYFKDPISAHGLTDALRDAELLARAVFDGFGDDAATAARLDDYQRRRDRLSIALFDTVDRIAGNDWDDAEIAQLLKQLSASMADEIDALAALDLERVP